MIKPEQVPFEALEAFIRSWTAEPDALKAIAAALSAWPGMATYSAGMNGPYPYIILPLPPQEASDV